MSKHSVSALKYRPNKFADVIGQDAIAHTLNNAIQQNKLAHAYLFCGPRGVGKTSVARIFARLVNEGMETEGQDFAFNIFELDAASNNSVDDIRQLIDQVRIQPQLGEYKIYIIDEVHMLSQAAFNAFLKTLEEPPPHAIFILATTEKHKVLPTIISRCQVYDFSRISVQDIASHLEKVAAKEGVLAESEALHLIAQKADGALRDALSIFDQIVNFSDGNITYNEVINNLHLLDYDQYLELADMIAAGDISNTFLSFHKIIKDGFDGHQVVIGLAEHFRNLLMVQDESTVALLEVSPQLKTKILEQSSQFQDEIIFNALNILNETDQKYSYSKNQNLLVEISLMKLCKLSGSTTEKKRPETLNQNEKKTRQVSEEKKRTQSETNVIIEEIPIAVKSSESEIKASTKKNTIEISDRGNLESPIGSKIEIPNSEKVEIPEDIKTKEDTLNIVEEPQAEIISRNKIEDLPGSAKPKLKIAADSISLLDISETKLEENKEVENLTPTDLGEAKSLDEKEMLIVWKDYAEIIKEQKKYSFYSTLSNRNPEIKDENTISLMVENDVQLDDLNEEKVALMSYLRTHLKHPNLRLEADKTEEEANMKLQTPREKYMAMLKKNPTLGKLTEQLDLDLDY